MKKLVAAILLVFTGAAGFASGVEQLSLDMEFYREYLGRITHSKPVALEQLPENETLFAEKVGQRVTIVGFVRPVDGGRYFTRGFLTETMKLYDSAAITRARVQFETSNPVVFLPFEGYQVTGMLEKNGEDGYMIRADYAEPQGQMSRAILFPDLASETAMLPAFGWEDVTLPRHESGELICQDPEQIVLPEKLAKLSGKRVVFTTWLLDEKQAGFAPPATGSHYISAYVIVDGACRCCGENVRYDLGNTAMLRPADVLPETVEGGTFMGTLTLNASGSMATDGLFTIVDAVLVRPKNLPGSPPVAIGKQMKLDRKDILPALMLPEKSAD
jgi:hypothetical protein